MLLTVAKARQNTYIECMAETHEFTGTIVRIERDGFGIVQFNKPIGAQANAYGVFSTTLGSTVPYGPGLKPGQTWERRPGRFLSTFFRRGLAVLALFLIFMSARLAI